MNHPSSNNPFTCIVDYKHFLKHSISDDTVIVRKYITEDSDPYYPVSPANYAIYQKLAEKDIGCLATYKYYIVDAILTVLKAVKKL